ncbi:MAG: hypothetical protein M3018_07500 [Actinomycetota bacterium]|nr:hypothetical protein [Actinomycetota bacterium]
MARSGAGLTVFVGGKAAVGKTVLVRRSAVGYGSRRSSGAARGGAISSPATA